jgi:hypothetical protein
MRIARGIVVRRGVVEGLDEVPQEAAAETERRLPSEAMGVLEEAERALAWERTLLASITLRGE